MVRVADAWFPELGDNITRITWAHAVNDKTYLQAALASEVLMLEADIVMGHLVTDGRVGPLEPVMAHPPATESDVSLQGFLEAVAAHNERVPDQRKGVKLDFKSIEAFEASESIVAPLAGADMKYPVWLNADILPGPVDSTTTPVDADRFLRLAAALPRATLSIGWTTRYAGDTGVSSGVYTHTHAADMLRVMRAHAVAQPVTFPVRAGLAAPAQSRGVLLQLLQDAGVLLGVGNPATLTVWGSEGDPVDVDALRELVLAVGLDRVYLDLPADLSAKLQLPPLDSV